MVEKEDDEKEKVLEMSIDELELSVRSYNCLKRAGKLIKVCNLSNTGIFYCKIHSFYRCIDGIHCNHTSSFRFVPTIV